MNLRSEVSRALIASGFTRTDRMHMRRVTLDWSFWVDTGPIGRRCDIAPRVGIRHDGIERKFAELMNVPADNMVGTIGTNIGYIRGQGYQTWEPPSEPNEVMAAITEALELFRPFLDLQKVHELWKIEGTQDPLWRYREIILFYIRGEECVLLDKLQQARTIFCARNDAVCEQYLEFTGRLRKKMQKQQ